MYIILSSIWIGYLGLIWKRNNFINLAYKIIMIGLALWGGFTALENAGYIIAPE